ncbi:hypothetical protein VPH35_077876 [Triticum aestivum]
MRRSPSSRRDPVSPQSPYVGALWQLASTIAGLHAQWPEMARAGALCVDGLHARCQVGPARRAPVAAFLFCNTTSKRSKPGAFTNCSILYFIPSPRFDPPNPIRKLFAK